MRALMGLIKNRHGVYNAQRRVPVALREAVAIVLGARKASQSWLKKSLGTKDLRQANILAKPVLADFDRIIARAEALVADTPVRSVLSAAEITSMADYLYGSMLAADDQFTRDAPEIEREERRYAEAGESWVEAVPAFGRSGGQMLDAAETMAELVPEAERALEQAFASLTAGK